MNVIVTLDNSITAGGGHAIYTTLQKDAEHTGREKLILLCPDGDLATWASEFVTVQTVPNSLGKRKTVERLWQLLVHNPEVTSVHIHGVSLLIPFVTKSIFTKRFRIEYTEHLYTKAYLTWKVTARMLVQYILYFFMIRYCSHVYCVSRAVQECVTGVFLFPSQKTSVVYNVIPYYGGMRKTHQRRERVTLIAVGALQEVKNHEQLVAIVSTLPENYHLEIIGDGERRDSIEKMIIDRKLGNRVRLRGRVPHEEVMQLLQEADIFCSTSHTESFGFAIAEAMSVGLPVIAFRVGGIPEVITHGKDGLLIAGKSSSAFAAAIKKLGEDPELRQEMGENGVAAVKKFQESSR